MTAVTYAGSWRSWTTKAREGDAEAQAAAGLGDPGLSAQHMTDWGTLADVVPFETSYDIASGAEGGNPRAGSGHRQTISSTHGADNTAVGRQQLGAGHAWADAPPPLLSDHADVPPGIFGGGGPLSGDDYNGQDPSQHNTDYGEVGERRSGHWAAERHLTEPGRTPSLDEEFVGSDDVNYPAVAHQWDRGEIASKQRRQITRTQSADEKDTTEGYQLAPSARGGSQAQIVYSRQADPAVAANTEAKHDPGPEHKRAEGPAVSWANAHGTGPADGAYASVRNRRWVERRIPGRHFWTHDMRPLFWRFARTPGGPGTLPGSTHQTSPFPAGLPGSGPDVAARLFSQPMIRRAPPAWDETAASDGTESGEVDTSGMWSGFGGM